MPLERMAETLLSALFDTDGKLVRESGKVTLQDAGVKPSLCEWLGLPPHATLQKGRVKLASVAWGVTTGLDIQVEGLTIVLERVGPDKWDQAMAADTIRRLCRLNGTWRGIDTTSSFLYGLVSESSQLSIRGLDAKLYEEGDGGLFFSFGLSIESAVVKGGAGSLEGAEVYYEANEARHKVASVPTANAKIHLSGHDGVSLEVTIGEVAAFGDPSMLRDAARVMTRAEGARGAGEGGEGGEGGSVARPDVPCRGNSRVWWGYVLWNVRRLVMKRRVGWRNAARRVGDIVEYSRDYLQVLTGGDHKECGGGAEARVRGWGGWDAIMSVRDAVSNKAKGMVQVRGEGVLRATWEGMVVFSDDDVEAAKSWLCLMEEQARVALDTSRLRVSLAVSSLSISLSCPRQARRAANAAASRRAATQRPVAEKLVPVCHLALASVTAEGSWGPNIRGARVSLGRVTLTHVSEPSPVLDEIFRGVAKEGEEVEDYASLTWQWVARNPPYIKVRVQGGEMTHSPPFIHALTPLLHEIPPLPPLAPALLAWMVGAYAAVWDAQGVLPTLSVPARAGAREREAPVAVFKGARIEDGRMDWGGVMVCKREEDWRSVFGSVIIAPVSGRRKEGGGWDIGDVRVCPRNVDASRALEALLSGMSGGGAYLVPSMTSLLGPGGWHGVVSCLAETAGGWDEGSGWRVASLHATVGGGEEDCGVVGLMIQELVWRRGKGTLEMGVGRVSVEDHVRSTRDEVIGKQPNRVHLFCLVPSSSSSSSSSPSSSSSSSSLKAGTTLALSLVISLLPRGPGERISMDAAIGDAILGLCKETLGDLSRAVVGIVEGSMPGAKDVIMSGQGGGGPSLAPRRGMIGNRRGGGEGRGVRCSTRIKVSSAKCVLYGTVGEGRAEALMEGRAGRGEGAWTWSGGCMREGEGWSIGVEKLDVIGCGKSREIILCGIEGGKAGQGRWEIGVSRGSGCVKELRVIIPGCKAKLPWRQVTCLHMAVTHGGAALSSCRRAVELAFEAVGGGGRAESVQWEVGGWERVSVKVGAWQLSLPDGIKNGEEEAEDEEDEDEENIGVCLVTEELVAEGGNESAECVFGASFRVCKENVFGLSLNLKVASPDGEDAAADPTVPRTSVFLEVRPVAATLSRYGLASVVRCAQYNAWQAEEARRGHGGEEAGVGEGERSGWILDRRRVGVKVSDWMAQLDCAPMSLSLSEGGGRSAATPPPFIEFGLASVHAKVEKWSDTSLSGSLVLGAVHVRDLDQESAFSTPLCMPVGEPSVTVTASSDGESLDHDLSVHLSSFSLFLAPSLVLHTLELLLSASFHPESVGGVSGSGGVGNEGLTTFAASGSLSRALAMPVWRRRVLAMLLQPLSQAGVLKMVVSLKKSTTHVILSERDAQSARASLSLGLTGSYHATLTDHTTRVTTEGCSLSMIRGGGGSETLIMPGLSIGLEMLRSSRGEALEMKNRIALGRAELTVSYQDVKTAWGLWHAWREEARESGVLSSHGAHEAFRAAQRAAAAAASRVASSLKPEEQEGGGEAQVALMQAMTSEGGRAVLINDCVGFNVPLCEVILGQFGVQSGRGKAGKGLAAKGQVKFEANFYNGEAQCYEPIVEPFRVDVASELYADASGAHHLSISSKQRLEINVAQHHLCSAMSTFEAWSNDFSPHFDAGSVPAQERASGDGAAAAAATAAAAKRRKTVGVFWPYRLRNECGCVLRFWAGRVTNVAVACDQVAPGGVKEFAFSAGQDERGGAGAGGAGGGFMRQAEYHSISLQVVVEHANGVGGGETGESGGVGEFEIVNVPVDSEGVHMFPLGGKETLVVEIVSGPDGAKHLLVQSIVKLQNSTVSPLEFSVLSRRGDALWSCIVPSGEHTALPMTLSSCYALALRPSGEGKVEGWDLGGDGGWGWSDKTLLPILSQPSSVDVGLVRCQQEGKEGRGGYFQVRVDAKRPDGGKIVRAVISVHPVLTIHNLLPTRVSMTLIQASLQACDEEPILDRDVCPGESLHLHSFDQSAALGLALSTCSFPSVVQPALIFHPEGDALSTHLEMLDERGDVLHILLKHDTSQWGDSTLSISPEYVAVNKTGVPLTLGVPDPTSAYGWLPAPGQGAYDSREPLLVSFDASAAPSTHQLCFAVGGGEWSKAATVSSMVQVTPVFASSSEANSFGPRPVIEATIQTLYNPVSQCRVITIRPRITVSNALGIDLEVCQQGLESLQASIIHVDDTKSAILHWGDANKRTSIRLRGGGGGALTEWSGAVPIGAWAGRGGGSHPIRMPLNGGSFADVKVELRVVDEAMEVVVVRESSHHPSYLIDNRCDAIRVCQVGSPGGRFIGVPPTSRAVLCWDEPSSPHRIRISRVSGGWDKGLDVDVDDEGGAASGEGMGVLVERRGPTRVVVVRPLGGGGGGGAGAGKGDRVKGRGRSRGWLTASGSGVGEIVRRTLKVSIGGIGIAVLDGGLNEVLYGAACGVKAVYVLGVEDESYEVKVSSLQIDNTTGVGDPLLLSTRSPHSASPTPSAHLTLVRRLPPPRSVKSAEGQGQGGGHGVGREGLEWVRYCAVSVQTARVSLHEGHCLHLLGLVQAVINSSNLITDRDLSGSSFFKWLEGAEVASSPLLERAKDTKLVYVEALHMHPIRIKLSYTPTGEYAQAQAAGGLKGGSSGGFMATLRSLNLPLPSVDAAEFSINALIVTRVCMPPSEMGRLVLQHYRSQTSSQFQRALQGPLVADFWGSGAGSGSSVGWAVAPGASVEDTWYDPSEGVVKSPEEVMDAGDNWLKGGLEAAKKIQKAVARVVDEGEAASAMTPSASAAHKGEDKDGVSSMLAGFGRSILGEVMRPTAGLIDLAVRTGEGLSGGSSSSRAYAEFGGRVRPPRPPSADGLLRCYDEKIARGMDALNRLSSGTLKGHIFVGYARLRGVDALLLTDKLLIVHEVCTLDKRFIVDVRDVVKASTHGSGVSLSFIERSGGAGSRYLEGLAASALGDSFNKTEAVRRLECDDLDTAEEIVASINACLIASKSQTYR